MAVVLGKTDGEVTLYYSPKKGRDMEFRVYSLDEGAFMVDNIEVGISL